MYLALIGHIWCISGVFRGFSTHELVENVIFSGGFARHYDKPWVRVSYSGDEVRVYGFMAFTWRDLSRLRSDQ